MLRCASCGSIALEGRSLCGVCGGKLVDSSDQTRQFANVPRPIQMGRNRAKPLAVLTISVAVLVEGIVLTFLPISAELTALGFFVMGIGALMVLATLGVFSGTPYRSRILNRADQELKRRERRKYSD
jgi:O-antigen/teichoic acid export membrane protein